MDTNEQKEIAWRNIISGLFGLSFSFLALLVFLTFSTVGFQLKESPEQPWCGTRTLVGNASASPEGETLFKQNCAACHFIDRDINGPALSGILDRAPNKAWVRDFIRNPQGMIDAGDAYAVHLYNAWNQTPMTAFPTFTDEQIDQILIYID